MSVKRTGQNWTGEVKPLGLMSGNGVYTPFNMFGLKILDFPSFRSSHPRPGSAFVGFDAPYHAALDVYGHAHLAPGKVQTEVTAIAKHTHLGIAKIPQMMSAQTRSLVPNWAFIVQGYLDYIAEAKFRNLRLVDRHFWMRMEHPWHSTTIQEIGMDAPSDITPGSGYLLVNSTSTALVEFMAGGNSPEGDLYTLKKPLKPRNRRYIVEVSKLFEDTHPVAKLCFTQGLFAYAVYYAEGDQDWQRGAQYVERVTT